MTRPYRKRAQPPTQASEPREDVAERQAKRARRRGEHRKAMLLFREAACLNPDDARLWTLYGAACLRLGRCEDGVRALSQALWLRDRGGDDRRALVTRRLLDRARAGNLDANRAA